MRTLRHAARTLARSPGSTLTIVLTVALGVGANSAVFSAIDAVLLRPLPFPEAGRLLQVDQRMPRDTTSFIAPTRLTDWNRLNSVFQGITGSYTQDESETSGELPERLKRAFVAPRFLEVLGIAPAIGRDFRPEEQHFGGPDVVLISDRFWRRRFGADPGVAGRRLRFGRLSSTITGVMPASFAFPDRDVDLWSPVPMDAPYAQDRHATWFTGVGRLKPAATLDQARANMETVQRNLGRQYPATDADLKVRVQPLKEAAIGGVRGSLWILFGSVSLLLLLACGNIAALLLARATGRREEIAIRYALGASRADVVRQALGETLLLSLAGSSVGLLVAAFAPRLFRTLAASLPRVYEIQLNWRIAAYSLGCALAVTLIAGLLPALRETRPAPAGRSQVSGRHSMQFALVGMQVALAVTLLTGAGLLLRSLQELGRVSPGYDPSHVLTLQISFGYGETADIPGLRQRTDHILDTIRAIPGVEAAAISTGVPGTPFQYSLELQLAEGRAETEPRIVAQSRAVSAGYFETLQIPLLAGEQCRASGGGAPGALVNRSFANTYLNGSRAVGLHLRLPSFSNAAPFEIRGIAGDARENGIDRAPEPIMYPCYAIAQPGTIFLVRTRGEPMAMAETLRRKIHEIEPLRSVFDVMPLEQHLSDAQSENRLRTILLTSFAVTAVSLACVGLFGTLGYVVNMRRREIGLRMALGGTQGRIVAQFLKQGLVVSAAGCAAGLALALALRRTIAGALYGVSASDPATLGGVAAAMLLVAALASLAPAARAARIEPLEALRDQ